MGGGYIVIGQNCDLNGVPIRPPAGIPDEQLDRIQQELLNYCNVIRPVYFPILSVETYLERNLIVLWCPGGQNRPYKAPRSVTTKSSKEYRFYIRRYSSTVELKENSEDEQELLRLTATIPFDDRQCGRADLGDLRPALIQSFLTEVGSDLRQVATKMSIPDLGRRLNVVEGADEHAKPRNVGILFFHNEPTDFIPGAQIDVVIFPKGTGGGELTEKSFRGPVHEQVRASLRYLQDSVIQERVTKHSDRAEATRIFNYPFAALEEVVVNAVYHRSYEQREPVEVRVTPDKIQVVSYPGPDASIRIDALNDDTIVARRYRNRRIGDFLKELELTEGRCTGIPTIRAAMANNGSPPPRFSTDEGRTYFLAELPVLPDLKTVLGRHDEAHDEAHDELTETEARVLMFIQAEPKSRSDTASYLGINSRSGNLYKSIDRLRNLGFLELTIPDKPQSKNQKMRITRQGQVWLRFRLSDK